MVSATVSSCDSRRCGLCPAGDSKRVRTRLSLVLDVLAKKTKLGDRYEKGRRKAGESHLNATLVRAFTIQILPTPESACPIF